MKKKQTNYVPSNPGQERAATADSQNAGLNTMVPGEELQIYYNDAYMKERQRFNDIFGMIESDTQAIAPEKIYIEPSPEQFVTTEQHKKTKRKVSVFALLTVAFAAAAVIFALLYFKIF